MARFDANKNGYLDPFEKKKAREVQNEERYLIDLIRNFEHLVTKKWPYPEDINIITRFDSNNDGKLDDEERTYAIKYMEEMIKIKEASLKKLEEQTIEERIEADINKESIKLAISVAEKFLSYVDRKYIRPAQRMSYKMKKYNDRERKPFTYKISISQLLHEIDKYSEYGELIERKLVKYRIYKTMSSMPDGEYVVLCYLFKFQKKSEEYITIVIKTDDDQQGSVVAYPYASISADK